MFGGIAMPLLGWLKPVARALSARLRALLFRVGAAVQTSARERPWPSANTRAGAAPSVEELRRIRADLCGMLDHHALARRVLRHLACVERSLIRVGAESFDSLPPAVMQLALSELEAFVDDWSPRGLAELRIRLSFSVIKRAKMRTSEGHEVGLSAFWVDSRMQVSEASLSAFDDEAMRWNVPSP